MNHTQQISRDTITSLYPRRDRRYMRMAPAIAVTVFLWLLSVLFYAEINCEPLNVHLIPHTHDDVGYRKTVDQYYYGGII